MPRKATADTVADDWDEFPNGRWGDSRSPAYGDLDGYPVSIGINVRHHFSPFYLSTLDHLQAHPDGILVHCNSSFDR